MQEFSNTLTAARILFALSFVSVLDRSEIDDDSFSALMTLMFRMDDVLRGIAEELEGFWSLAWGGLRAAPFPYVPLRLGTLKYCSAAWISTTFSLP